MNLKSIGLILFALLLSLTTLGQDKKSAPSRSMSKSRSEVNSLLDNAEYSSKKDAQQALNYLEEALRISIKQGDKIGEANTYVTLGNLNMNQSLYAQAINFYTKGLAIFQQEKNTSLILSTRKLLGTAYEKNQNYTQALAQYQTGLNESEVLKNEQEILDFKNRIAHIYQLQGKNDDALNLYKDVLSEEIKQKNKKGEIDANNNIGDVYIQQNKLSEAKEFYGNSQEIAIENEDEEKLNKSYDKIINTYKLEGNSNTELDLRLQKTELNKKNNDTEALAKEYLEIGKVYLQKNNTDKALTYLEKSVHLSQKKHYILYQSEAELYISNTYKLKHNYLKALEHYQIHVQLKDSLIQLKELNKNTIMSFNDELTLKQKQIDLLEKDMQLNATTIQLLQKERSFSRFIIYALSIGILLIIVGSWLIYTNARKRRIANQALILRSLRSQMNPHFIFNALNSVSNFISKNDERSANKYLSDFSKLMRTVMENTRHEFISLSTELSILNLYLSLEHARFSEKFDYKLTVSENLSFDTIQIPPMLIQPYIENAIWHGLRYKEEKGILNISITKKEKELIVIITDNGIGRKKSLALKTHNQKDKDSIGIKNTEARIKIINELYKTNMRVSIEDLNQDDNCGTQVILYISQTNKIEDEA